MRRILITSLLVASTAHAENWQQVADLDKKGGALLVDTASIDRDSEVRNAWFKTVYTTNRPVADGYRRATPDVRSYRWELSLGHFNCTEQTLAVSKSTLHDADNQLVGTVDIDSSALKFVSVAPPSVGWLLLKRVCAPAPSDAQPALARARVVHAVSPDKYYPSGSGRGGQLIPPVVNVCVGPSGKPLREPEISETSGYPAVDVAAIKVAKAMRYAAAVQDAVALPESCIKFKVKFGGSGF